jgi:hypothetical protein
MPLPCRHDVNAAKRELLMLIFINITCRGCLKRIAGYAILMAAGFVKEFVVVQLNICGHLRMFQWRMLVVCEGKWKHFCLQDQTAGCRT